MAEKRTLKDFFSKSKKSCRPTLMGELNDSGSEDSSKEIEAPVVESSSKEAENPSVVNEQSENGPSTSGTSKTATSSATRKRDSFHKKWLTDFPWLESEVNSSGISFAFCKLCRDGKKSNAFAKGTTNMQYSAFGRHETSKDHLLLISSTRSSQAKIVSVFQKQEATNEREKQTLREAEMRTMLFLTKHSLPLHCFNDVVKLQKLNGAKVFDVDRGSLYVSGKVQSEMVDAINTTIEREVDRKLKQSKAVGIIVDESTDVAINKKLTIYARIVLKGVPEIVFVDCVDIEDGRAQTIVKVLDDLWKQKGMTLSTVTSLSSDGASVMTGCRNGVGAIIKRLHNPRLIHIHCVAHRLALAAGDACRTVGSFEDYQTVVRQVYRFFANSPVRYNSLRMLQEIWKNESGDGDCPYKVCALKEPATFRWLSLHQAVNALHSCYPALVAALEHEAEKNRSSEAKGLANKVKSVGFVLTTAFLLDVLPTLTKLSKKFQEEVVDISIVQPLVKSSIAVISALKDENGPNVKDAYAQIETSGVYNGVKVADRQSSRMLFQRESVQYATELCSNLESRFDPDSMGLLRSIEAILNPANIPATNAGLREYGLQELEAICEVFGKEVVTKPTPNLGDAANALPVALPPLIDSQRAQQDFHQVKVFLRSGNFPNLQVACEKLCHLSDTFPDYAALAQVAMASPITSVACERGFSVQNRLITKFRARLLPTSVSKLMRIAQQGPDLASFDATSAAGVFNELKQRRK